MKSNNEAMVDMPWTRHSFLAICALGTPVNSLPNLLQELGSSSLAPAPAPVTAEPPKPTPTPAHAPSLQLPAQPSPEAVSALALKYGEPEPSAKPRKRPPPPLKLDDTCWMTNWQKVGQHAQAVQKQAKVVAALQLQVARRRFDVMLMGHDRAEMPAKLH